MTSQQPADEAPREDELLARYGRIGPAAVLAAALAAAGRQEPKSEPQRRRSILEEAA
jgi:hypothetical protein